MSIGDTLGKKLGPLPVGVWGLAIAGGLGVAVVIRRRSTAGPTGGADEYGDAYAPWEQGGNTATPPGAGNLYTPPAGSDVAPDWAADLADSITDLGGGLNDLAGGLGTLTTQVEGLYYVVPTPGGPGQGGGGGGGRKDTGAGKGAPAPKPIPTVKVLRDRFDDKSTKRLSVIERNARERAKVIRRGGIAGPGEARGLAVATNRARAARAERAENRRQARQKKGREK
jgi:hypothetical protein